MAGMVMRHNARYIHLTQGVDSLRERKKNIGSVILSARPKSLLSAIIEASGPYSRYAPPVAITHGNALATKNPKHPDITITSIRKRWNESTMATVITAISITLETMMYFAHVSAEW